VSKTEKLLARLRSCPSDFTYEEITTLLKRLGYRIAQRGHTSGSRLAFIHEKSGHIIRLHNPHPGNTLKRYQVEFLVEALAEQGVFT
jgi:hypothetical protein